MCGRNWLIYMYVFRLNSHALGMKSDYVLLFHVGFHHMYVDSVVVSCRVFFLLVTLSLLICIFSFPFSPCHLIALGWCYLFVVRVKKYIVSYHIIPYHTNNHIISHHIVSYHIVSYIISYHLSYHILHHIMSSVECFLISPSVALFV